jgi:hypothetical protein
MLLQLNLLTVSTAATAASASDIISSVALSLLLHRSAYTAVPTAASDISHFSSYFIISDPAVTTCCCF